MEKIVVLANKKRIFKN